MSDDPSNSNAASPVNSRLELPSSVIERYLARRSHGGAMVFEAWLVLDGSLDIDRLREAWRMTLDRHPRVHSVLVGRGRRQHWRVGPVDLTSSFVVQPPELLGATAETSLNGTADSHGAGQTTAMDGDVSPHHGVGAKLVVSSTKSEQWGIRFLFHHACCDGVGAARMMDQVFRFYQGSLRAAGGVARRQEPPGESQRPRATPGTSGGSALTAIPDLRNVLTTVRGRNIRLRRHGNVQPAEASPGAPASGSVCEPCGDETLVLKIDPEASARVRDRLRRQNVSLNDFAVAATLHALAAVTSESAARSRYIMVMNPVETRQWADRRSSANHLGFAFIRRRHDELTSLSESVESVSRQLRDVRRFGFATELASGIAMVESIPGALRLVEKIGWFTPTASLTCVSSVRIGKRFGVATETPTQNLGAASLHSLLATAPIQCGGELAVTAGDTGKQIVLTFRYADPQLIDLTKRIGEQWHDFLHGQSPSF